MQAMLDRPVDAASLATRKGPGNQKLPYLPGHVAYRTANGIFGYRGWNSDILHCEIDYCVKEGELWHVGGFAKAHVWVEGHWGHVDYGGANLKGKDLGELRDNVRKAACTDARKRALRIYGESLGNTCYDKDQVRDIEKSKKPRLTNPPPPPPCAPKPIPAPPTKHALPAPPRPRPPTSTLPPANQLDDSSSSLQSEFPPSNHPDKENFALSVPADFFDD